MKRLFHSLCISIFLLPLAACQVDPAYDLDNLDPEITVLKTGLRYPLGWTKKMRLDALFNLDVYSVLQCDETGDYYLMYRPSALDFTVTVSEDGTIQPDFDPFTFTCYSFPDAIVGDNPTFGLDYSKSEVTLQFDSGIPAAFTFGIDFETYVQGNPEHQFFHFDDLAVTPGPNTLVIQDEKLFNPIPNGVKFNGLTVSMTPKQQSRLVPGTTYSVGCRAVLRVPLAFLAGTEYTFEDPLNLFYDMIGFRVRQVLLDAKIVNTIPVDFEVSALCLDQDKNPVPGVSGRVDKPIAGGTADSPAETRVRATLSSESGSIPDRLTLRMTARVPAPLAGTILNREQAIELSDIRLSLPEGIQIDLF